MMKPPQWVDLLTATLFMPIGMCFQFAALFAMMEGKDKTEWLLYMAVGLGFSAVARLAMIEYKLDTIKNGNP